MSSTADVIFQTAEAISAISLPVGGGLAAYAKWRRNAERDRRAREEAARIASERAAKDARLEEQAMRDRLLAEKDSRINSLLREVEEVRAEVARLNSYIIQILHGQPPQGGHE